MIIFNKHGPIFDLKIVKRCFDEGGHSFFFGKSSTPYIDIKVESFDCYCKNMESDEVFIFGILVWPLNKEMIKHAGELL